MKTYRVVPYLPCGRDKWAIRYFVDGEVQGLISGQFETEAQAIEAASKMAARNAMEGDQ
jgi:hypothetical protein